MDWLEYILAFAAFFLTHSLPVRPPMRPWLQAWLGRTGFGLAYSALSLASLTWIIIAAARAPYVPLWDWAPGQNHVVLAAMAPVCMVAALAVARPNPFSFGGARNDLFDPSRPGIVRVTRHPLLLAMALWAGAHIVPNGDLAHVILFGTFFAFALFGGRLVDRRKRREMGSAWDALEAKRRTGPLIAPQSWSGVATRLVLAAGLYLALLWLHPWLFGVSPLA